jgi:tetratricopeptide (TPR) repeat protein
MRRDRRPLALLAAGALVVCLSAQDKDLSLASAYASLSPRVEKARSALRKGRLDKCEAEARACLGVLPGHHEAHFLMSQVLYKRGDYEGSLGHILAAESGAVEMTQVLSVLEQRRRRVQAEEMERLTGEVTDLAASAATVKSRGSCLPDKYDAALRDTQKELISEEEERNKPGAAAEAPGVPALYRFWHGNILFVLKRTAEAEAQYRLAIRSDPDFGETYNNLINLLFVSGRKAEAREVLSQAESHKARVHPELKRAVLAD